MTIQESVQRQFGQVASNYASSAVHVGGPDLEAMLNAIPLVGSERLLDAGSGAGHTALAFAPRVAEVVAADLTAAMLEQGRRLADERGLTNLTFRQADVEQLPFPDASFDIVTSRYSAHHYPRPQAALAEFVRVLRPGGHLLLVDTVSYERFVSDTFLQAIELLRDPSHVRDHTVAQWLAMCAGAGLTSEQRGQWTVRLDFTSWVTRMRTPEAAQAQIRALLDAAPQETRAELLVEQDHSFSIQVALVVGRR
jgi:ubiquinone/menaquinone biosynthesis C-methylase UbiE